MLISPMDGSLRLVESTSPVWHIDAVRGPSTPSLRAKRSNPFSRSEQEMDCFVADASRNDELTILASQLPPIRRVIRLIDGELVHGGLPEMIGEPGRLQVEFAVGDT